MVTSGAVVPCNGPDDVIEGLTRESKTKQGSVIQEVCNQSPYKGNFLLF